MNGGRISANGVSYGSVVYNGGNGNPSGSWRAVQESFTFTFNADGSLITIAGYSYRVT